MSPLAQLDCLLENILRELTLRFVVPRLSEFDSLWDTANRICDRNQIKSISSSAVACRQRATALRYGMLLRPVISTVGKKQVGAGYSRSGDVPNVVAFPLQAISQIRDPQVGGNSNAIDRRPAL